MCLCYASCSGLRMKSKVLLLLAFVLQLYAIGGVAKGGDQVCTDGGIKLYVGERDYSPYSENSMKMCAVTTCTDFPFLDSNTENVQCSKVNGSCSILSTPHDRNLSVCCKYCSECDFLTCPLYSTCEENSISGASCQCVEGYAENVSSELSCVDVDECAISSHDCPTHSDCVNFAGGFDCSCHPGYSGSTCGDIDECMVTPDICPNHSECVNRNGFYECICNEECRLAINSYYLTTPSEPDDFFVHNQGCLPDPDGFPGQDMVVCTGRHQLLTDRFTRASIPPAPNQYVGWDRSQGGLDGFTIIVDANHTRLTRLDAHFYNNPSAGIGLPEVSSIHVSSSQSNDTFVGPLSFVYARNEHLSQSDDETRTVSIIITDNLGSTSFYRFVKINFVYSSSTISRTQLTEIQGYGGTDSVPSEEEITFLSGSYQVVRLGVDDVVPKVDLSCTVANPGRYTWEWTRASDGAILSHSVNLADLTRTSILTIDKLSMEASGEYICQARRSDKSLVVEGTAIVELDLTYEVIKDVPAKYTNHSDLTFSCEFIGYYPQEGYFVQWDFEGQALNQDGDKYAVTHDTGSRGQSQSGRDSTGPSVISSLTIFSMEEQDKGIYGCRIIGESCHQLIGYILIGNAGSSSEASSLTAESCPTETVQDTDDVRVWFFLFLVELGIITLMVLVIIVFICVFCCKYCHGNLNMYGDSKEKGSSSLDYKIPSTPSINKYVVEVPVYDVINPPAINAPAEYEVIHAPAAYEVSRPVDKSDKKESE